MSSNLHIDDDDLDLADMDDNIHDYESNKTKNMDKRNESDSPITNDSSKNKTDNKNNANKRSKVNQFDDKESDNTGGEIKDVVKPSNSSDIISNKDDEDSKFFVVRVSGGQESMIASTLQSRLNSKKIDGIFSILFLDNFKGYVIVEAVDSNIAYEALHGIRHIRGQIRGELPFKDLEGYLIKKPVVTELTIDDTVEVIAGPFKSMKAKITRVDYEKQEATVVLLDSPYQIPVTVDANYLKKSL